MGVSAAVDEPRGLARKPAALTAVGAALVFAALAAALVPWSWVPGGTLHPAAVTDVFTRSEIARAEQFSSLQRH